jgi:hypothetical protein
MSPSASLSVTISAVVTDMTVATFTALDYLLNFSVKQLYICECDIDVNFICRR